MEGVYLDYVLFWPNDGRFTAKTCRLEIQLLYFDIFVDYVHCVFIW